MSSLLHRWGLFCARRAKTVLVAWALAVVAISLVVGAVGAQTDNDLSLPGTDSQRAFDLLAERFPPQQNGSSPLVLHVESGELSDKDNKAAVEATVTAVQDTEHVASATDPFANSEAGLVSDDGRTAFIPVLLDVDSGDLSVEIAESVVSAAQPAVDAGIEVQIGGPIGSTLSEPDTESSEAIGILVAMVILALTFGGLVAMGMPIVTAIVGLVAALGVVGLVGHLVKIPSVGATLATMIGLGVGIDYALFLVTRHRAQLLDGVPVHQSVARTVSTAGNAVVFAGGTVVIALLSLAVAGIPFVTSLGIACAIAVVLAVLAAITFLPALLAVLGHRLLALRLPAFLRPKRRAPERTAWARWGNTVTRRPLLWASIAIVAMIPLVIPTFSLELGQEDIGVTPTTTTERQAFDLVSDGFGPGYNGPLVVANELDPVATPSDEYDEQYSEATSLQDELTQEQKDLTAQADTLQAEQADLETQQAELESESAALRSEQSGLERQKSQLQRERAALEREQAALEQERVELKAERADLRAEREALEADVRSNAADLRADERALADNRAEQRVVQDALDAATDPLVVDELEDRLAALEAAEADLEDEIAQSEAALRADRAEARELVTEAAALAERADDLAGEARTLAREAADLTEQAVALQDEADALTAEGAALQAQADDLQAEASSLQAQADDLQAQQAAAQDQKKQAEALQDQITDELTLAGGDPRGTDPRLVGLQSALTALEDDGGVLRVGPPIINESGNAAYVSVVPTTRPADSLTADLVGTIRDEVVPDASDQDGMTSYVGGSTASNVDLAALISSRLLLVILTVFALSFLLLLLAFRSLLVPLQAVVTNLLSVAAAFGVLTAVFQWGWGLNLIGLDSPYGSVPIASYVPLMMFAALFGLSMDYEVFLVSQVQHAHLRGASPAEAVRHGLDASGKVIVAAASIMIAVFGSFILNGDPTVKQFGVGLSVAVFLAAVLVLVLAPAMLTLFGRATFWLPAWLDRALPHLSIEGDRDEPGDDDLDRPGTDTDDRPVGAPA